MDAVIWQLVHDAEAAIHTHPNKTTDFYRIHSDAYITGMLKNWRTTNLGQKGVDGEMVGRLLLSYSFISAWHQLAGDQRKSDQALSLAMVALTSYLDMGADEAMGVLIKHRNVWMASMSRSGVVPGSAAPCIIVAVGLAVLVAVIAGIVVLCFWFF